jgi:DNA-directed RNA polymerase subunit RPC12/RpoP
VRWDVVIQMNARCPNCGRLLRERRGSYPDPDREWLVCAYCGEEFDTLEEVKAVWEQRVNESMIKQEIDDLLGEIWQKTRRKNPYQGPDWRGFFRRE